MAIEKCGLLAVSCTVPRIMGILPAARHVVPSVRGHVCKLRIHYKHYAIIHHMLLFFHVRPANRLTIICVTLCHKKFGRP
jgi:hypothetical protein